MIPPILLVGCGRMGSAMLAGWLEAGLAASYAVDPAPQVAVSGLRLVSAIEAVPDGFAPDAVVLAVKPQNAAATLPDYARFAGSAVFLSIMAGRTVRGIQGLLSPDTAVVRAMPNTPAAVRQGVTVAVAGPGVSEAQRDLCDRLLTAIGLPPGLARMLARQTVSGSGALLAASTEESAALRRAVTSPRGTTERALAVLMADGAWPELVSRAISDATARSRELAD
jgi:pyrroline-5-carboxylate reductase